MPRGSVGKTSRSKSTPFYKQGWLAGLGAVVSITGGILGIYLGIAPLVWKPHGPFLENVEIVLDRSGKMALPFEGNSKLESAVSAMDAVLRNQGLARTNLAYREFGGDCSKTYRQTSPTVAFRQDNAEAVRSKAHDLIQPAKTPKATGDATLVDAINQAIGDFSDTNLFGKVSKRIIVITGDTDACNMPLEAVRESLARLQGTENSIELDFKFIAVGLEKSGEASLKAIAELTKGTLHFVYDQQQLRDVLHELVLEEPGQSAADATRDLLDASVQRLDQVTADLRGKDYPAGRRHLQEARAEFDSSETPFRVLSERQTEAKYQKVFVAAQKQRDIQRRLLALGEAMLSEAQSSDEDRLRASREQYSGLVVEYNAGADDLKKLLTLMRAAVAAK
ncbi:MAG TPA: hypothetical protein VGH49_03725 [Xanthobacteraceae bacterium]